MVLARADKEVYWVGESPPPPLEKWITTCMLGHEKELDYY